MPINVMGAVDQELTWTNFKAIAITSKNLSIQYFNDSVTYTIWAFDGQISYATIIWQGTVPDVVVASGYSQSQNNTDLTDFTTNYLSISNKNTAPAIKAASTSAAAADPSLVIALSPNSPLPTGGNVVGAVTQSGSWTISANQGTATTLSGAWPVEITDGANVLGTSSHPIRVDPTGTTTQPISGSVTANVGTTGGLALDTSINGVLLAQGSTTSGEKGPLIQGAVTTSSPSYTTAQTSPLSLTTAGALRVDGSATTQPISGSITTSQGTAASLSGAWPAEITDGTHGPAAVKAANVAAVAADPALVVAISPNNSLTTSSALLADRIATNTISALNGTVSISTQGVGNVGLTITGTWSATLSFQGSVDGTNWFLVQGMPLPIASNSSTVSSTTNNAQFTIPVSGLNQLRIIATSYSSGTATITLEGNQNAATTTGITTVQQTNPANLSSTVINNQTAETTAAWTSSTSLNTTISLNVNGYGTIAITLNQGSTITGGVVTFEVSDTSIGTNWYPLNVVSTAGANVPSSTYTLVASTNFAAQMNIAGFVLFRVRLSTVISGSGTVNVGIAANASATEWQQATFITDGSHGPVAVKASSTAPVASDPALVVSLSPNSGSSSTTGTINLTSTSSAVSLNTTGLSSVVIQITGITSSSASCIFEGTVDNSTWWSINSRLIVDDISDTNMISDVVTEDSIWSVPCAAINSTRIRCVVAGTGTATVFIQGSSNLQGVSISNPLPSGFNLIGNVSGQYSFGASGTSAKALIIGGTTGVSNLVYPPVIGLYRQLIATDYEGSIATGEALNASGLSHSAVVTVGGAVSTTASTLVAVNASTYTEPTSASTLEILSSSSSDTSAGTGARTVSVKYVTLSGGSYLTKSVTVTLNGVTAVSLGSDTIQFVENILVLTVGSNASNVGTLTLRISGGGATVGIVNIGDNVSRWAHHYVAGSIGSFVKRIFGAAQGISGSLILKTKQVSLSGAAEYQIHPEIRVPTGVSPSLIEFGHSLYISTGTSNVYKLQLYVKPDSTTSSTTYAGFSALDV